MPIRDARRRDSRGSVSLAFGSMSQRLRNASSEAARDGFRGMVAALLLLAGIAHAGTFPQLPEVGDTSTATPGISRSSASMKVINSSSLALR